MLKLDLTGDGRLKLLPVCVVTGNEISVRKSMAKRIIADFDEKGYSNHSGSGSLLWLIVAHCVINKIPYALTAVPGFGYSIKKVERPV